MIVHIRVVLEPVEDLKCSVYGTCRKAEGNGSCSPQLNLESQFELRVTFGFFYS